MKKYTIVSTYPKQGSKNIGDALITKKTKEAIQEVKGENVEFSIVWREQPWREIKDDILSSDAVIFACLAIRKNMRKGYPFLEEVISAGVPYGAIASGTKLQVGSFKKSFNPFQDFSKDDLYLIKQFYHNAQFFSNRGALSQKFCEFHGLNNAVLTGDVAFFDNRYAGKPFSKTRNISNIVISDPHYPHLFLESLKVLFEGLSIMFPNAKIKILFHGENKIVENHCKTNDIPFEKVFENPETGLDAYEEADLHIGYRVHGHVSALTRRIPSYLLEQDGRGADYGLTIRNKISVANYVSGFGLSFIDKIKHIGKIILNQPTKEHTLFVSTQPAHQVLALVQKDFNEGFEKFQGLGSQIDDFNRQVLQELEVLP